MSNINEETGYNKLSIRKKENYVIMTIIYDELSNFVSGQELSNENASYICEEVLGKPFAKCSDYLKKSINSVNMNYGKIVTELSKYLNNWTWERLPLMTQSILLISYAHFYYVEEIAKAIVIDIALELAKKFIGDTKQIGFINGILDNALKNDK